MNTNDMADITTDDKFAVCLVSGGLDSCVTAAIALSECDRAAFLHVNYGQRTERRELKAFEDIANYYNIKERLVVSLDYLSKIGGSALTDKSIKVPENELSDSCVPVTYVPFRNTHIIAIAVSWAEVIGAGRIYIGATEVDSSGYPDCRQSYYEAYNRLIEEGTRPETRIKIHTPLIRMTKRQVVEKGASLGAPFHLTWSCYQNEDKACGVCDSCLLRLKGFKEAGMEDPIPYQGEKK